LVRSNKKSSLTEKSNSGRSQRTRGTTPNFRVMSVPPLKEYRKKYLLGQTRNQAKDHMDYACRQLYWNVRRRNMLDEVFPRQGSEEMRQELKEIERVRFANTFAVEYGAPELQTIPMGDINQYCTPNLMGNNRATQAAEPDTVHEDDSDIIRESDVPETPEDELDLVDRLQFYERHGNGSDRPIEELIASEEPLGRPADDSGSEEVITDDMVDEATNILQNSPAQQYPEKKSTTSKKQKKQKKRKPKLVKVTKEEKKKFREEYETKYNGWTQRQLRNDVKPGDENAGSKFYYKLKNRGILSEIVPSSVNQWEGMTVRQLCQYRKENLAGRYPTELRTEKGTVGSAFYWTVDRKKWNKLVFVHKEIKAERDGLASKKAPK
jgi:hypothetical protein